MVMSALLTAICCAATMAVRIPSPTGGYINAGDSIVLLSAFLLGPFWGAAAAGIGSALADILAGYMVYAPATLVIKALMALCAGMMLKKAGAKAPVRSAMPAAAAAEVIMILGYFGFTATVLGFGWGALPEVPGNIVQGIFGAVAGTALFAALINIPYVRALSGIERR